MLLAFIFINTRVGQKFDWHGRWREEPRSGRRFRAGQLLWLVALPSAISSSSEPTWTAWYSHAHLRGLGLVPGTLTKTRLEEIRRRLIDLVEAQRTYHERNAILMRRIERRIEILGYALFGLAILFAATNMFVSLAGLSIPTKFNSILLGLTAALPALGAATFGIRLIGDFEGIAHRDERTSKTLSGIGAALQQDQPKLAVLRSRTRSIADVMLGDLSHWRISTETRKLVEPA